MNLARIIAPNPSRHRGAEEQRMSRRSAARMNARIDFAQSAMWIKSA
jgi:hypothetical protein